MDLLLLIARLLLAAVFVVAGIAKLADLAGSRQALRDFGLPRMLATPFGVLLPLAELAVAAALLPTAWAWGGALGALALLLLFMAAIGVNLARGHTPDCHCFGQLHATPVGWSTLVRNGLLGAVAGLVVWQGRQHAGASAVGWWNPLAPAQRVELLVAVGVVALLAGEGWVLLQALRQQGRLLVRLEALEVQRVGDSEAALPPPRLAGAPVPAPAGLPVGSPAPAFTLPGLYGETLTLEALRAPGQPVLLLFTDPGCGPCAALLPEMGRWQREHAATLTLALLSRGGLEVNRATVAAHGIAPVLLQQDREVAEAYQVGGTPGAVLVRPDGAIGSPVALGAEAIRALVARALDASLPLPLPLARPALPAGGGDGTGAGAAPAPPPIPTIGAPAPAFTLPDLAGQPVALAALRGRPTLVLFWNPGCGFCQQMLEDLKAWEAHPPAKAPQLLVVSTGTVEANQADGLRSPLVLDQGFGAGQAFGATGTPMAVLIDAEGKIASEVVAGASAVLTLAGHQAARASA